MEINAVKDVNQMSLQRATDSPVERETASKQMRITMHIPYILNGELYKIKSQEGEHVTVKCCNCPPDRLYRGSIRSTGNFHMHIKRRHPDLLGKLHNMKVNALVERRDRLMKTRAKKSRNTSTNLTCGLTNLQELTSTPIHMHNLKIKRVFERHQKQAEEAKTITPMVIIPGISTSPTSSMESFLASGPLDLSSRSNTTLENHVPPDNSTKTSTLITTILNSTDTIKEDICPESIRRNTENYFPEKTDPNSSCSISGDDCFIISGPERTNLIDLTTTTSTMEMYDTHDVNVHPDVLNSKWLELIQHAKSAIVGIQHEIRTRNHIEMNRLMLEIAKFKFIHPTFNFQFSEFK